ncbi:glycosyltransferase [Antarcticibacterium flavum]|uniref:Glycosyltransferase n=1 Tax=Antarcticibacterium flavum TaxID=2058175 RepID=A0A5B7X322_9FLAO|nr:MULTISPECIES: glycosyltransferase [Antarcticibacterium]MCM4159416.1 glycosyltransferase [Antarcticibacterium sp. W02-3]QCY69944.1 glycosyltransferase [Antarcticibacterium flavum]
MHEKKILVAPLNWGLGHATRCIPIIRELQENGFTPVLASDGEALRLLEKEFPLLERHGLPSYDITYSRSSFFFPWKLLLKTPHILRTIKAEKAATEKLVRTAGISGIISDNRWGVRSVEVPSVFITHQIKVLSGLATFFSSKIQQNYIKKFDECWVPDVAEEPSLSGRMGHTSVDFPVRYLGVLSRFEKLDLEPVYDLALILSGPEPQRSLLEKKLLTELNDLKGSIIMVRGIIEKEQSMRQQNNIRIYNFMTTIELEKVINQSLYVICRPGYTSLMDLAKLEKKLFVIPTPGQFEQEYLAKRLEENHLAGSCKQKEFTVEKYLESKNYKGLLGLNGLSSFKAAFALFQSE